MLTLAFPLLACTVGALAAVLPTVLPATTRLSSRALGWLLSGAPLVAFIYLAAQLPHLFEGHVITWQFAWLPALGLNASLYLDGLSVLFGLIVTGIGALVLIYAGYYFDPALSHAPAAGDAHASLASQGSTTSDARFFLYILLFMASMLGLVLAGDVITLFVFWEGTSVTSFLLIAYKTKDAEARKGAFKALFVTGAGGIALLAGLLFVAAIGGGSDWATILSSRDVLRASPWYPVLLALIAFGAFTKSAQAPFHFWLPTAMSAPTPASAYLHSATMVKAGVYILARLHPALGNTELWFWLLAVAGATTMLTGAILGLRQVDLKAVLAYSTISQLGVLVMLIGEEAPEAFKALTIGVLAHALYKGALFMIVGIVDHTTGTRDLRRLGRIWRAMPLTFVVCSIAALSMAGLPPLFGFLAKEALLAAEIEEVLPAMMRVILPALTVLSGAFILAQAGTLALDTFVTPPGAGFFKTVVDLPLTGEGRDDPEDVETIDRSKPARPHLKETLLAQDPPAGMLIAPAALAALSLVITVFQPQVFTDLLASAASAAYGVKVKVSLDLFHGLNVPLLLSALAIGLGVVVFRLRSPIRSVAGPALSMNALYERTLNTIDRLAGWATRTQGGRIRIYLTVILMALFGLLALFGNLSQLLSAPPFARLAAAPLDDLLDPLGFLRAFSLILAVAAALVSVVIRRDFLAILALSASGLAVAVLIALEPSPDVALVQVVVDLLSTVILVLALSHLPIAQLARAEALNHRDRACMLRNTILAVIGGAVVTTLCLYAFASRPRESVVTPFFEQNAKPLTGADDIVGAVVVDFRGFDTLIEISVFSVAGVGVFTLLRYAMTRREALRAQPEEEAPAPSQALFRVSPALYGIDGKRASPFIHALAYLAMPLAIVLAAVQIIHGHHEPGDGFTAGVTLSLAVGFWYVVFGFAGVRRRLRGLRPGLLIGLGLLIAVIGASAPMLLGGAFFSPVDFGAVLRLPLPEGVYFSTSFLFELAICLAVFGASLFIIDALGHPEGEAE
ncbi:MAG: proton-conducting transporter membrane subunit [Anaerolineae bacterium]|nr:DUF4040 domain-containing protein [Thermoflexales bacterium]MDW8406629.1 proton-conducting transporter membrane subunit [Anaerolineae bacterium]